jgi:hypothetical protein
VALFDYTGNIKLYFTLKKSVNLKPGFESGSGIGSGSAFVKKARSRSAYNEYGSEKLLK